jgi:hypothetical protein
MSNIVRITKEQHRIAVEMGWFRYHEAIAQGKKDRKGILRPERVHICGALSEMHFAHYLGIEGFTPSHNEYSGGKHDVMGYEVRSQWKDRANFTQKLGIPYKNWLKLKPSDPGERIYVLVLRHTEYEGEPVGWILGDTGRQYAQRLEDWGDNSPSYNIPIPALSPMHSLPITPEYRDYLDQTGLDAPLGHVHATLDFPLVAEDVKSNAREPLVYTPDTEDYVLRKLHASIYR